MTYPWEAYVTLDPSLQGANRERTIESLNHIYAARDGEGVELLRAAHANNGGPVTITGHEGERSMYREGRATINLDEAQIGSLYYRDPQGNPVPASTMGVLVHELYHAGDNQSYLAPARLASLRAELRPEQQERFDAEVAQVREHIRNDEQFREADYPLFQLAGNRLRNMSDEEQRDRGIHERGAGSKPEEDATRYTDAFMEKNGWSEPVRQEYRNAVLGDTHALDNPYQTLPRDTAGFDGHLPDEQLFTPMTAPRIRPQDTREIPMETAHANQDAMAQLLASYQYTPPANAPTNGQHVGNEESGQFTLAAGNKAAQRETGAPVPGA